MIVACPKARRVIWTIGTWLTESPIGRAEGPTPTFSTPLGGAMEKKGGEIFRQFFGHDAGR